jgi:hypothetical protein
MQSIDTPCSEAYISATHLGKGTSVELICFELSATDRLAHMKQSLHKAAAARSSGDISSFRLIPLTQQAWECVSSQWQIMQRCHARRRYYYYHGHHKIAVDLAHRSNVCNGILIVT